MNEVSKVQARDGSWLLMISAAAILTITMGARQSIGLFLSPINTATGVGIEAISLAMAIGQFTWGAVQPAFGAIADKFGSTKVLVFGTLLLAAGTALTPFATGTTGLIVTLGLMSAAGAGAGSFSILIGATAQRLAPERRSFAAGFINAGGSFGQFLFAPIARALIDSAGWVVAMFVLACSTLLSLPFIVTLRGGAARVAQDVASKTAKPAPGELTLGQQVRVAFRNPSYIYLHLGFFTCGFHIAFLVTHLPGEVALCGLPASIAGYSLSLIGLFNIVGSLSAGALSSRYRMKFILAATYAARAVIIMIFLAAPKTALTFYMFGAALGLTWLATVPPTAGIVGKLFGTRYLGTLFGLTLLSHQIGGFCGAYFGGKARAMFGDYTWMWYADIVLALAAALVNLPIREPRIVPQAKPA
jgi:MFS family permease